MWGLSPLSLSRQRVVWENSVSQRAAKWNEAPSAVDTRIARPAGYFRAAAAAARRFKRNRGITVFVVTTRAAADCCKPVIAWGSLFVAWVGRVVIGGIALQSVVNSVRNIPIWGWVVVDGVAGGES